MNKKKCNRIIWLDLVKGMCMFFIIMSHSHSPNIYVYFYTPFFLCTFFFTSGYTFNPKENYKIFVLHKSKTLLVPYFCFGFINAFLAFVADGDSLLYRFKGLLLSQKGNDDLWFIMCLFVLQLFFYWIHKIYNIVKEKIKKALFADCVICLCSLCLAAVGYVVANKLSINTPFQLTTSFIMAPFMTFGFLCKENDLKEITIANVIALFVIYIVIVYQFKNEVSIHRDFYSNIWLFIIEGVLGVYLIVSLSKKIAGFDNWVSDFFVFIGANTLVYYAFQSKLIRLLDMLVAYFDLHINYYILSPLYAMVCCAVLAVPALIINKYFPFILGKK